MSLTLHASSAPIFVRSFTNMLSWFDKAEAHAKERGFDPENYLTLRLAPDMHPLPRQVQIASDAAKGCVARLSGTAAPSWPDGEQTLAELRERIRKTIAYVDSVPAAAFEGAETREVVLPIGAERTITFPGQVYLQGVGLPNFFFHVTMTYALLRHAGVALGKMDYLGAP